MEFWVNSIIELFDILAWPISAVIVILYVTARFEDISVKHGDTEIGLKSKLLKSLDLIEEQQSEKASDKELKIVKDTIEKVRKVLEDDYEGGNVNGRFKLYKQGNVIQQIRIPAGQLEGKRTLQFPAAFFKDDYIQVTIVGSDKPSITELTNRNVTLELEGKNAGEIVLNFFGASDVR